MKNLLIKKIKKKLIEISGNDCYEQLEKIEKRVLIDEKKAFRKNIKVLIGPSFAIWPLSFVMDRSLSNALRLKGVDVIQFIVIAFRMWSVIIWEVIGQTFLKVAKIVKKPLKVFGSFNPIDL